MKRNLQSKPCYEDRTGKLLLLIFCLVFSTGFTTLSGQPVDPFTKITDDNYVEAFPTVEGDYIVFRRRNIALDNGIYLYHIPTGDTTNVMKCDHTNFGSPDMSGDRIVWQQLENGSWDIYTYLISRPDLGAYPLIDYDGDQQSPAIHGDILVWIDGRGDEYSANLFMYNISTAIEKQLTTDEDYQQGEPDVYGNYIVWSDGRSGSGDIYMYNIYKEEFVQITDNEFQQRNPTIHKKRIVWEDKRNGNWDLYLHYIDYFPEIEPSRVNLPVFSGEIGQLNPWAQINAQISDNYIVYQDNRSYNWDIYLFTFINPIVGASQPLVTELRDQTNPTIWENKIVWQDGREYTGTGLEFNNLWMWEKPPGVDLALNIDDGPDPVMLDSEYSYMVLVSNFGNQSAYNPELSFTLPSELEFISMSGFGSAGYSRIDNEIYCLLDSVPAGKTDTVIINVGAVNDGLMISSGDIQSVEEDIDPANNSSTCETNVIWKIPTRIDNGAEATVVVDGLGIAHFCYLSNSYEGKVIYGTFKNGIIERQVIDNSDYNNSPAIAVDKNNNVHIAYGHRDMQRSLRYVNNIKGVWSEPEIAVDNAGDALSICIKTDMNDSVHISYMTSLWPNGSIWYSRKQGTWNNTLIKSNSYNSSSFDLDTAGYAHFSYYDLGSYGICYKTNSPDGILKDEESPNVGWQGGQMESLVTDIAVDNLSRPHISYVGSDYGNEDYKYAVKNDQIWEDELLEVGDFAGSDNTIDTDPNGNPHVCFHNRLTDKLIYTWKEESSWYKHNLYFSESGSSGDPKMDICVDHLGYVHILGNLGDEIFYITDTDHVPIPEPEIKVLPQSLDFIERLVGDTTDAKKVIISNIGEADLVISDISLVWRDSVHFSISRSSCSTITPGDTCSVDVKFNPQILGDKQAMLWITSNDPANPTEGVSLIGTGLQGLLWDYGSQVFGDVNLGDSVINEYTLKNEGNTNLVVQGIYFENGAVDDFKHRNFPELPFSISDGDSIIFDLLFKPTAVGDRSVTMKIYSTGGQLTRTLSGTGLTPVYNISGEVRLPDNSLVTEGWIWVINLEENSPHPKYYYKPLEGAESFVISGVPELDVTLRFDPDEATYPAYLRTYLGNTPFMEDADIISLNADQSNIQIILEEAPAPGTGISNVSGVLYEETGGTPGLKVKKGQYNGEGSPVEDVPVFLLNSTGEIVHTDITDSEGVFDFSKLSIGEYFFKVDYEAYPMSDQNDTLFITKDGQKFEMLAVISNEEISFEVSFVSTVSNGLNDLKLKLYPNPFSDYVNLELKALENEDLIYGIYDLTGRCVLQGKMKLIPGTTQNLQVRTEILDEGYYILKLRMGAEEYYEKLLKLR